MAARRSLPATNGCCGHGLWDAKFFWDQDRKIALEDRLPALEPMVFHAELGSLRDKVGRIETLARQAGGVRSRTAMPTMPPSPPASPRPIWSPAWSASFPSCRASWAGYYARQRRARSADVAQAALAEHYRPQGPGDANVPTAPVSVAVALADKLDTL